MIASKLPEEKSQGLLTVTGSDLAHIITKEGSGVLRSIHKCAGCLLLSSGLWPASSTDPGKGDLASPDDKFPASKEKVGCA